MYISTFGKAQSDKIELVATPAPEQSWDYALYVGGTTIYLSSTELVKLANESTKALANLWGEDN
jgi:hypothetical protein